MLNNKATEAKYNTTISIDGLVGIQGDVKGLPCFAETVMRLEITNVGPLCQIDVQGKLRNSNNWYSITTATGPIIGTIDISTYDYIRYVCLVADGTGTLCASGFLFTSPSNTPAGSSTSANQVITNNYLASINNKVEGTLIGPVLYDDIQINYTNPTTETYTYWSVGALMSTVVVTYSDSTKRNITRAQRV